MIIADIITNQTCYLICDEVEILRKLLSTAMMMMITYFIWQLAIRTSIELCVIVSIKPATFVLTDLNAEFNGC